MSDLQPRRFVVVSGLPGSGKTTAGRLLAAVLNLSKESMRLVEARGGRR